MSIIMDAVHRGVMKVKENKQPSAEEILALSLYLGGENTLRLTDNVKVQINNINKFANYRNRKTISSPDGKNYIIGETIPIHIMKPDGRKIKSKAIINIELLMLETTPKIEGDNPIEILMNLPDNIRLSAIRNNKSRIKKHPLEVNNSEELLMKLHDLTVIEESEVLIYAENQVIIVYKKQGVQKVEVIIDYMEDDEFVFLERDTDIFDNLFL